MKIKYVSYDQYLKQEEKLKDLMASGVMFIHKKSKTKIIIGCVCLVIAIIPNGTGVIFYPLGFGLLVSGGIDIHALIRTGKQKLKFNLWKIRGNHGR